MTLGLTTQRELDAAVAKAAKAAGTEPAPGDAYIERDREAIEELRAERDAARAKRGGHEPRSRGAKPLPTTAAQAPPEDRRKTAARNCRPVPQIV